MSKEFTNDERAAVGHLLVLLTNRINEMDDRIAEIEVTMQSANYLLRLLLDKQEKVTGDT